ncbi:MAG: protein kinase [Gemmatimonadaceae bacterium]|nr:protein kinase [Gemmatimonadaceae bacterium]
MSDVRNTTPDAVTIAAGIAGVCASCGATVGDPSHPCPKCGNVTIGGNPAEQNDRMRVRLQEAVGEGYKLLELLGRGGMGIVFRAREMALDREVALKVLALDPVLAPDAYQRFEREARLAARLDHPHIVPIFAVGQRQNVAFYTMRLVRGGSLEDLIGSGKKQLSLEHVVKLLHEVAAALDHAHRQGVVHRDIKPANVLLGETGHAMVADFGIAKALSNSEAGSTGTGIIGSPGYMSPEQWKGTELDGRADQYSLGVVAYEMLCGRRPFETPQIQDLLRMHLSAEVPPITYLRTGLPEGVDEALRRALAKDPSQRFSSVTAFVDALAGLRSAAVGAQTQRGPRFETRKRPAVQKRGVAGVLVPLLLVGAVGSAFAFPETRDPIMSQLQPAIQQVESLAGVKDEQIRAPRADSLAAHDSALAARAAIATAMVLPNASPAAGDSAIASHDSTAHASTGVPETGGATTVVPIALDTSLGAGLSRTRGATSRMQYGWIRVVINGGAALARIDGEQLGMTPLVARVEAGEHLVTVLGAGDSYLPSQISVVVESSDTAAAIFSTPEALQRMREQKRQDAAAKARQQTPAASPNDSATSDSASKPPR